MPFDNIMFKLKYCVIHVVQYKFSLYRRRRFLSTIVFVSDIMRQVKWQKGGLIRIKARPAVVTIGFARLLSHDAPFAWTRFFNRFAVDSISQITLVTALEKVFGLCSLHLAFPSFIECSLVDYSDLPWEYENLNMTYYLHRTFFGIQCCRGYAASLLEESRNFGPGSAVDLSIR